MLQNITKKKGQNGHEKTKQKLKKTKIGKNVFIGSDTQLVAPVTVEDDVMIAAGTTVTSGTLPQGVLALSRTKLRTVKDFYYKFFGKK